MSSHKTERAWAAAIRRSVMRQVSREDKRTRLEAIADKVTSLAVEGDMSAIAEVGNRLDGKAKQQLEVEVNQRMTIVIGGTTGASAEIIDAIAVEDEVDTRGMDTTDTSALPPPDPYAHDASIALPTEKHVRDQHVGSSDREDETVQQRIARLRARALVQGAQTVPVDGVIEDVAGVQSVYVCAHAATDKRVAPCAVCTRVPSCPRRSSEAP